MKRIPALLLTALLLFPLVSCGTTVVTDVPSDSTQPAETAAVTEEVTTADYLSTLPDEDLDGMELRFIGVSYANRPNLPGEEENGEPINDAMVRRDRQVEDDLNIAITYRIEGEGGASVVQSAVTKAVTAGDDVYDCVNGTMTGTMTALAPAHCLYNLLDIPYITLGNDWWSPEISGNLPLGGKLYFTLTDIYPQKFYAPYVMTFNRKLAEDYNVGDIYGMVIDGQWTNDVLAGMTADLNHDLDGDGEMTKDDFWAYAHVTTTITTYAHYVGSGMQLCKVDGSGLPVVELDTEKSVRVLESISRYLGEGKIEYDVMDETNIQFCEGRALFFGNSTSNVFANALYNFREMNDDFGIIPVPKYDEAQDKYYAYINTYGLASFGVTATCPNIDGVGLALEEMAYLSYTGLRDAVYDITMKQKVARDDTSGVILDMIFDNIYIDLNGVFNFGGSANTLYDTVMEKREFSSGYAAVKDKIAASIEKTVEQYQ